MDCIFTVFLQGSQKLSLRLDTINQKYQCINETIKRLKYGSLKRKEKRIVLSYLRKITGYKKAQLLSLIQRALLGELARKKYHRLSAYHLYTREDIKLVFDEKVIEKIVKEGFDPDFGARPLKRFIQDNIEGLIAKKKLTKELSRGKTATFTIDGTGALQITVL